jgi:hypothetical protein
VLNGGGTSFVVAGNGELLDKSNPLVELPDRKEPGILRTMLRIRWRFAFASSTNFSANAAV